MKVNRYTVTAANKSNPTKVAVEICIGDAPEVSLMGITNTMGVGPITEREWSEFKVLVDGVFKKVAMAERGSN